MILLGGETGGPGENLLKLRSRHLDLVLKINRHSSSEVEMLVPALGLTPRLGVQLDSQIGEFTNSRKSVLNCSRCSGLNPGLRLVSSVGRSVRSWLV